MLVLCLAVGLAGGGLLVIGGGAPLAPARVVFHIGAVAGLGLVLALAGLVAEGLGPLLMGTWFAMLAAVYGGHAFAVGNWGSPMNRWVLLFGLRKLPQFARLKPRLAVAACPALAVLFGVGWAATRFDVPASGGSRRAIYLGGACVLLGCATLARCTGRASARADLVLGLALGGDGPTAGPPPNDPSLGPRRHRPAVAARRGSVIVFVVDSLRPQNMSVFGYERPTTPFLTELLARRGARAVPLAVSNSPTTINAYWSLFSSRRTRHHAVNAPCLHDLLVAAGFTVRFFLSGAHRDWMGLEHLYGNDHHTFVDCLIDEQLVAEARKLPEKRAAAGDLLFFHLMSTHQVSGCEPPPVWKPARNRAVCAEWNELDAAARELIVNHYDNSVLQADDCIGRIMDVLGQKGHLENAVVVVTGDHGEALGERNPMMIGHGLGLYQESIHVPLIVWDSTQALPEPVFLADQTDIAPTVLALLGMEPPSAWQGSSLFAPRGRQTAHVEQIAHLIGRAPTHMEALLALLPSGAFKIMRYRQAGQEILSKAFCLTADPGESDDLHGRLDPNVEVELENALRVYHEQPALALAKSGSHM